MKKETRPAVAGSRGDRQAGEHHRENRRWPHEDVLRRERRLTYQLFAKDDSKTVSQALAESGLKAEKFTRWMLGNV